MLTAITKLIKWIWRRTQSNLTANVPLEAPKKACDASETALEAAVRRFVVQGRALLALPIAQPEAT